MSFKIYENIDRSLESVIKFHEEEVEIIKSDKKKGKGYGSMEIHRIRTKIEGIRDAQKVVLRCFKDAGVI